MALNVFVTRRIPEAGLATLQPQCGILEINPHDRALTREELLRAVAGRDGVVCMLSDAIDDETLAVAGPQCRVFANYAVGFNNIDLAAATRRGICVTNTPGVLTDATADLTWALIMSVARRIVESDRFFRTGQWDGWGPMQFLGHDVYGATLGVIGAGRIGTAVGLRASGFNMRVLYVDDRQNRELEAIGGRQVDFTTALRESDFLSLHVPLTAQTVHLIGAGELAMMKPTACLINTARGPVVDERALVAALRAKQIGGAGLDVYENEPAPAKGLTSLDNVVCIPHLGSATHATRSKMAMVAAENVIAVCQGRRPPNLVNQDVWQQ